MQSLSHYRVVDDRWCHLVSDFVSSQRASTRGGQLESLDGEGEVLVARIVHQEPVKKMHGSKSVKMICEKLFILFYVGNHFQSTSMRSKF